MTIQEGVRKALSAGWQQEPPCEVDGIEMYHTAGTLLDPLFWKALGGVEGWGRLHCSNCKEFAIPVRKNDSDPEYWKDCCGRQRKLTYGINYARRMHNFIDALCDGLSPSESFEKVTKNV